MNKLLIATTNKSKKIEIGRGLRPLITKGITILTLEDVRITGEPVESGLTFEENARIKAKFYADQTNILTLADDGGLMIDALDGAPGVKSRRWPGYKATDRKLIDYAIQKLEGVPSSKRTAQLKTCICVYDPSTNNYECNEQSVNGVIAEKPTTYNTNGYPFRALFIVSRFQKFYDDLTPRENNLINHRLNAIQQLIPIIEKII